MNSYNLQDGQNIYDVVVKQFGDPTKVFSLVLDNDQNLDYDLTGVKEINYTPATYVVPSVSKATQKEAQKPTSYVTVYGQNLFDVSLQLYADASNIFAITNTSIDDDIEHNQTVTIQPYKSKLAVQKDVIDLSGRIIGTKQYTREFVTYIVTENEYYITTESGLKLIIE